jgi:membrane protease YdiL (CAAX protease family)
MPTSRSSRRPRLSAGRETYWEAAKRPLQILVFLLPLIIFYELALTFLLQSRESESVRTVLAHKYLLRFFDAFHIAPEGALHLGGIAIIVVLLIWHLLNRDPWKVQWTFVGFMALETILVTMPLLVLSQIIQKPLAVDVLAAGNPQPLHGLGFLSKFAISIGAGLYEELMFRMLLIAVLHTLLVDVGKASEKLGAGIAVVVSAAAFAAYHPLDTTVQAIFLFLAGLYFGGVYVLRGFGIVVGVHALYDCVTFALQSR